MRLGKSPNLCSIIRGNFDMDESNYTYKGQIHVKNGRNSFIEINYRALMVDEEIIKQNWEKAQILLIN